MFASTRILYCTWIRGPWFAGGPKCLLTRSHSDTLRQPLGEFERFAALQATCVAARRDQSAKRAHPLRSQRSLFRRVRRKQLRKPICHESKPSTQAIAEPTNIDFHRLPSLHLAGQPYDPSLPRDLGTVSRRANRQLYDDRSSAAILCQIAHISADFQRCGHRIKVKNRTILSNSDQLFSANRATIKVERSTSALSFRSSELSQPI